MAFKKLIEPLQRALKEQKYEIPTPIQEQAIPPLLEGKDMLGCAQTGTGKTAAFTLPLLQYLAANKKHRFPGKTRALILAPTRELAAQIFASVKTYGKFLPFRYAVVFGGVGQQPQVDAMRHGVDILVATPGRLIDLMEQGYISLDEVEFFVLDEADRMLDMGFIPDIRRIIAHLPSQRQSLFFSATLTSEALKLAHTMLKAPVKISVTPDKPTVDKVEQHIIHVEKASKQQLLIDLLTHAKKALIFTKTKHQANRLAMNLEKEGIPSQAIHGNKSQTARTQALHEFKTGKAHVLVATDIAARGIDVDGITHVFNFDMPMEPESYVHRIGRTARAGASGIAISFCTSGENAQLRDIERLIHARIPVMEHALARKAPISTGGEARQSHDRPFHRFSHKRNQSPQRSFHRSGGSFSHARDANRPSHNRSESSFSYGKRPQRSEFRSDESSEKRHGWHKSPESKPHGKDKRNFWHKKRRQIGSRN